MTYSEVISLLSALTTPVVVLVLGIAALTVLRALIRPTLRRMYAEETRFETARRRGKVRFDDDEDDGHRDDEHDVQDSDEALQRLIRRSTAVPAGNVVLTISTNDALLVARALAALQDLYVDHGFERPQIEEVTRGSVKIKLSTRIAAVFRDPRAREIMAELKIAGEEISLGKFSSENNERNASAAHRLAEAMADADEAEYVSDTMVMVKTTDENGKVKMAFRVPTPSELVDLRTTGSRELAAKRAREVQSRGNPRELTAAREPGEPEEEVAS